MFKPYCYLIKFKPTGQVYYGSRSASSCDPEELFNPNHRTGYFTSSKLVKSLIEDFGLDSFECQVRKTFKNKQDCIRWESRVLTYFNVESNPKFLNLDSKQQSHLAIQNNFPTKCISHHKQKICIRIHIDKPIPEGWVLGNINKRDKPTNKNTRWIHNPTLNMTRMIPINEPIPEGWVSGRPKEYYNSHSKKLRSREFKYYTNGTDSKLIPINEPIPEGWIRGRTLKNKPTGKRHHIYIWITDGVKSKQIPADRPVPEGWRRGRTYTRRHP